MPNKRIQKVSHASDIRGTRSLLLTHFLPALTISSSQELAECSQAPPKGISVALASETDLHKWHVTMTAPSDSAYAGGTFGLVLVLPTEYPFKAPIVTFATRIYHPNVTNNVPGSICLGLLKSENWKPATKIMAVLEAIRALLAEPMPDDPLETSIAQEYLTDRKEFEKNARSYVSRYAKGPVNFAAGAAASGA
jgi:ubiquitin-protein ligase